MLESSVLAPESLSSRFRLGKDALNCSALSEMAMVDRRNSLAWFREAHPREAHIFLANLNRTKLYRELYFNVPFSNPGSFTYLKTPVTSRMPKCSDGSKTVFITQNSLHNSLLPPLTLYSTFILIIQKSTSENIV
jgi:hypothetical protein